MAMKTHKGHDVEVIEGDAAAIGDRGAAITKLAGQMSAAAGTLQDIKSGRLVGEGYAMDRIKDAVGDVHGDLSEAARRYEPAGITLTTYSGELARIQAQMTTIVADCVASACRLEAAQCDAADADLALRHHSMSVADNPPSPADADSSNRTGNRLAGEAASAHTDLDAAGKAHDHNLDLFDAQWDHWHAAYEDAVGGLGDANRIGEDSTWEDVAGVIAVISEWVSWVGLAIAVLGLIIGGPIFAIAAIVVGVIALALTIALMFDGRKGWGDLIWAVVGVLPIGKLGTIFKAGKGKMLGEFGSQFAKQFSTPVRQLRGLRGFADSGIGYTSRGFKSYYESVRGLSRLGQNPSGVNAFQRFADGVTERMLFGPSRSFSTAFHESVASGSDYFRKMLVDGMPKGLEKLADAPTTSTFEAMWNTYKWTDRGVSLLVDGRPSGAVSPAGMMNDGIDRLTAFVGGLFR